MSVLLRLSACTTEVFASGTIAERAAQWSCANSQCHDERTDCATVLCAVSRKLRSPRRRIVTITVAVDTRSVPAFAVDARSVSVVAVDLRSVWCYAVHDVLCNELRRACCAKQTV